MLKCKQESDKELSMSKYYKQLEDFIANHRANITQTQIAQEIGISKQLLSKFLSYKDKSDISKENLDKILKWAKIIDPNINENWLFGNSRNMYNANIVETGLNLSCNSINAIKEINTLGFGQAFDFFLSKKELIDLLKSIKSLEDEIKKSIINNNGKLDDIEYAEYILNKQITNLVASMRQDYSKIYTTYLTKDLLQSQTKKDSTD